MKTTSGSRRERPEHPGQAAFVARVRAELDRQHLSENGLCKRTGDKLKQKTLNDSLKRKNPELWTILTIADGLGVDVWDLFIPRPIVEPRKDSPDNVVSFGREIPEIFGKHKQNKEVARKIKKG